MNQSPWKTLLLISLFFLVGCSALATPEAAPTQDVNQIRTQAAATVMAQVALTPSITPPPSPTTPPTATEAPTAAPTATTTAAQGETSAPTATAPAATAAITGTTTVTLKDQARWVSQTVPDGTQFAPNQEFIMSWTIQNVGQSTWTAGYRLRFFTGQSFGAPNEIELGKEVKPNDTVEIGVQMRAPARPGKYTGTWVMSNEARSNFKQPIYLEIVVPGPTATPTPTKKVLPTVTPSITPTP